MSTSRLRRLLAKYKLAKWDRKSRKWRISAIVVRTNSRLNQENQEKSELRKLAEREIRRMGITEAARLLMLDPANLLKMLTGKRPLSPAARKRMQEYFQATMPMVLGEPLGLS